MGITTAYACVYPMSYYTLFFVINMPAAALIGLFGAYELYNVLSANVSLQRFYGGFFFEIRLLDQTKVDKTNVFFSLDWTI